MGFWDQTSDASSGGYGDFSGGESWSPGPDSLYGLAADVNPAGAADDPFAYTKGSLLTPWEGHFYGSRFGSGVASVPAYTPFQYADINFRAPDPGTFNERYNDPGEFKYGDYTGSQPFVAPTAKDMQADPGYQARMDAGRKALEASKAQTGVLRTGGTGKALVKYGQEYASNEYDKTYGRKMGEYQMGEEQRRFGYNTNRANAKDSFDTNVRNKLDAYNTRLGAFKTNADTTLAAGRLGWDVAQGTWDRNEAKARQGYDDYQNYLSRVAAAGAAGNREAYDRALDEYKMSRDEFWTNQDRQYAILDNEDRKGRDAAYRYGDTSAGLATQRGDAQASGRVGSANAWSSAYGNIGNNAMDFGLYAGSQYMKRPSGTLPKPQGRG